MVNSINIGDLRITEDGPLFLIAGPCVIESLETTLKVAHFLKETGDALDIPVIFKTSYDKANRTSLDSYRGPGIDKGLEILNRVREDTGLPILSDVHDVSEVEKAAKVLNVLQIPAFLCRQTDLLLAAAGSGLPINIKKGQFLSPASMEQAIMKATSTGNRNIILTERGASFGYNNLVVDMRSIVVMKKFGYPVVMDGTHSVQLPGSAGKSTGGDREYVEYLARAAVSVGANGVFFEVHPDPVNALCDGPNSLSLEQVRPIMALLKEIHGLIRTKN